MPIVMVTQLGRETVLSFFLAWLIKPYEGLHWSDVPDLSYM